MTKSLAFNANHRHCPWQGQVAEQVGPGWLWRLHEWLLKLDTSIERSQQGGDVLGNLKHSVRKKIQPDFH